jgi:hypothetical protein
LCLMGRHGDSTAIRQTATIRWRDKRCLSAGSGRFRDEPMAAKFVHAG